jgi:uncharacterized protein YjlB
MKSLTEVAVAVQQINIIQHLIQGDNQFPNNGNLPLLLYKHVVHSDDESITLLLESNGWVNSWKDTIFDYDHYHSTAHEVLVVTEGSASIQFGGPKGIIQFVDPGDAIIIPAGVAHRLVNSEPNFKVVGAYPEGQEYDIKYGKPGERPLTDQNIRAVPKPSTDPIYGLEGPLLKNW